MPDLSPLRRTIRAVEEIESLKGLGPRADDTLLFIPWPGFRRHVAPFLFGPTIEALAWVLSILDVTCGLRPRGGQGSGSTSAPHKPLPHKPLLNSQEWPERCKAVDLLRTEAWREGARLHLRSSYWDPSSHLFRGSRAAWPTIWAQKFGVRVAAMLEGIEWRAADATAVRNAVMEAADDPQAVEGIVAFIKRCQRSLPEGAVGFSEEPLDQDASHPTTRDGLDLLRLEGQTSGEGILKFCQGTLMPVSVDRKMSTAFAERFRVSGQERVPPWDACTLMRYGLECLSTALIDMNPRSSPLAAGQAEGIAKTLVAFSRKDGFASRWDVPNSTIHTTRQGLAAVMAFNRLAKKWHITEIATSSLLTTWPGVLDQIKSAFLKPDEGGIGFGPGSIPNLIALWETTHTLRLAQQMELPGFSGEEAKAMAAQIVRSLDFYLRHGWGGLSVYGVPF